MPMNQGTTSLPAQVERLLRRAERVAPPQARDRYVPEWYFNAQHAEREGLDSREVARSAVRASVRLRGRSVQGTFTGEQGAPRALVAWLLVSILGVAGLLLGQLLFVAFIGVLAVMVTVFARSGSASVSSHWLVVSSAIAGGVSAGYLWWAWGVAIDADDAGAELPAGAQWQGAALLVLLVSGVAFVVAVVVALTRQRAIEKT
ncbi:hypothetical protein [Sediminihabitans luteus]|uniref:hypothetical protein n=1 Tax=Sediminihabitans luteus TaxID=1138585 RepID=UPI0012FE4E77|nr:hypothetical protein [Sediminihabitans luteus]